MVLSACEQDDPLGLISGAITDSQISASSALPDGGWESKGCSPANARPYLANGLAWCPKYKSSTEWLQIDLGVRATVSTAFAWYLHVHIQADVGIECLFPFVQKCELMVEQLRHLS